MIFEAKMDFNAHIYEDIYNNTILLLEGYSDIMSCIYSNIDEMDRIYSQELCTDIFGRQNDAYINGFFTIKNERSLMSIIDDGISMLQGITPKGSIYSSILRLCFTEFNRSSDTDAIRALNISSQEYHKTKMQAVNMLGGILCEYTENNQKTSVGIH